MGRKSREKRERRVRRAGATPPLPTTVESSKWERFEEVEGASSPFEGSDSSFWEPPEVFPDARASHLSDILAFEARGFGPSLFEGLEERGVSLPPPAELSEKRCKEKVLEILVALLKIQVFIIGLDDLSPKEVYSLLWNETLWEGCYVQKQTPGAITVIDASHSLPKSEIQKFIKDLTSAMLVH